MVNPMNYQASPYIPAPHLCNSSLLTAVQLISQFQDFCANIEHISHTPSLVFERLVANLSGTFATALELERVQHAAALEQERLKHSIVLEQMHLQHAAALKKCQDENETLQLSNEQLQEELAESKKTTSDPALKTASNPAIRTFYIHEVRQPEAPCIKTSKRISFARDYPTPPHLSIGLNMLDVANTDNIRIKAFASNMQKDCFDINIETWGNTKVRDGGCTWLETDVDDPDFQFGTYSTGEDYPWTDPRTRHTRVIAFPRAYSAPPKVVVWLALLDMKMGENWRVKAYTADITATGFTLHIDTWSSSVLYYATAEWAAYPADKPNIFSGIFSTLNMRPSESPQLYNSAYVDFGSHTFATPPRVMLAINSLDIRNKSDLRLMVKASNISATGMTWHLDSWSDTVLYSAGASYIALG